MTVYKFGTVVGVMCAVVSLGSASAHAQWGWGNSGGNCANGQCGPRMYPPVNSVWNFPFGGTYAAGYNGGSLSNSGYGSGCANGQCGPRYGSGFSPVGNSNNCPGGVCGPRVGAPNYGYSGQGRTPYYDTRIDYVPPSRPNYGPRYEDDQYQGDRYNPSAYSRDWRGPMTTGLNNGQPVRPVRRGSPYFE